MNKTTFYLRESRRVYPSDQNVTLGGLPEDQVCRFWYQLGEGTSNHLSHENGKDVSLKPCFEGLFAIDHRRPQNCDDSHIAM